MCYFVIYFPHSIMIDHLCINQWQQQINNAQLGGSALCICSDGSMWKLTRRQNHCGLRWCFRLIKLGLKTLRVVGVIGANFIPGEQSKIWGAAIPSGHVCLNNIICTIFHTHWVNVPVCTVCKKTSLCTTFHSRMCCLVHLQLGLCRPTSAPVLHLQVLATTQSH